MYSAGQWQRKVIDMRIGVVELPHGFEHPEADEGASTPQASSGTPTRLPPTLADQVFAALRFSFSDRVEPRG